MPYVPVRCRNELADLFSSLLTHMCKGNGRAGKLLNLFPKLLLHRASFKRGSVKETGATIARRMAMFLRGQVTEL